MGSSTRQGRRIFQVSFSVRWWWPWASGERREDEWVKVEAFRGRSIVGAQDRRVCTPVLVQVTAAPRAPGTAAVDVVAVLDISSSMEGEKMRQMKEVMLVVIDNLGPNNRLSLVLFDDKVHPTTMGLTNMTKEGRDTAKEVINGLSTVASHQDCNGSCAAALGTAAEILIERKAEGVRRLGCIMFLSGGKHKVIPTTTSQQLKFPVHTFGLGADHDARSLSCIADNSAGTYSFINSSTTRDAFKVFIDGITSVVATSVKLSLKPCAGVTISSIESRGYKQDVKEASSSSSFHEIQIADMCAGERKNFIVYLTLSDQDAVTTVEKELVTVDGVYQLMKHNNNQRFALRPKDMVTNTNEDSSPAGVQVHQSEVPTELLQLKLVKVVTAMAANQAVYPMAHELQREWEAMTDSAECRDADSRAVSQLGKDVDEMKKPDGGLYMLSWLSRHKLQRVNNMAHNSSPREWRFAARLRRPSCRELGVVLLAVFLAMLLGFYFFFPRTQPILPNAALDVMRHPRWPAMAKDLDVMVDRTQQSDITSFFLDKNASASDMTDQIGQYLYKAILFAAVLSDRYDRAEVYLARIDGPAHFEKAVRHRAVKYLQAMVKMTKEKALPDLEGVSHENNVTHEMNRHLYSAMVQANVLVTIRTPPPIGKREQQIHDQYQTIASMQKYITHLKAEKASCCLKTAVLARKVKKLGSSVHHVDGALANMVRELAGSVHDNDTYIETTTY